MKKKFLFSFMLVCISIFALSALNVSAETYGDLTYKINNGEITITDCSTSVTDVVIPEKIYAYPVTSIGDNAFYECKNLTSVTIPNSITSIGAGAFYNCTVLTNLTIPNSVTSIGDRAFYYCKKLTGITIPDSVTSIGDGVFYYCSSITSITIPNSVTSIGNEAFYYCSSLTNITIPNSVTRIGKWAFNGTAYYNNSSNWENDILYIGNHLIGAKFDLSGKRSIKSGIKTIADSAFSGCSNLTGITIPNSVTNIGDSAFYNCSSLTSITIPNSVTSIGNWEFFRCSSLTSIIIPGSVTSIGYQAFYECSNLSSITIPDSVTNIGADAFYSTAYKSNSSNWENDVLYIGSHLIETRYLTGEYSIKSGTKTIADDAFSTCSTLTSIIIPNSVTVIGDKAFYSCRKLSEVYYNGTEQMWDNIKIGSQNYYLTSARRKYFRYVTLVGEDGSEISQKKYDVGSIINTSQIEKNGYSMYLYTDKGCKNEFNKNTPITENTKLWVKYIVNQYTYKFVDDDGTVLKEETVDYGTKIMPPENPAKANNPKYTYIFIGWDGFSDGITQTDSEMIFAAKYSVVTNQYTYKFVDDDGTVLKEETVDYGTVVELPETPADKDPYTFDYWKNYIDGMTLTSDVEFTAVYKYKTYTITAKGLEKTIQVLYNDAFEIEPYTPGAEYSFVGYFTEEDGKGNKMTDENGNSISNYEFTSDITLYPYFTHELLNKIKINGSDSTGVGNSDIVKHIYFATDKDAYYLVCNIKYPENISLKEIVPKDFKYVSEDSRKIVDGEVYLSLMCQYTNDLDIIPINKKIEPFELIFDIPEGMEPQRVIVEITGESILVGENDYAFDEIINGDPIMVEEIKIIGSDTITSEDKGVAYTAEITPDYATNKEVAWSVDDEETAVISQDGILTPLKSGKVTITAAAKDGSEVSASKEINITALATINSLKSNIGQWNKEFNSTEREYTVYVPNDTKELEFTADFAGGTLKLNDGAKTTFMLKNRAKSVELNEDNTNVILFRENQSGCVDSEYKITVMKFEGTQTTVSDNGTTFTIKPINVETGNTVILALYDGDKFVGIQFEKFTGADISFKTDKSYTNAKVMVWNSLDEMIPVCKTETVK